MKTSKKADANALRKPAIPPGKVSKGSTPGREQNPRNVHTLMEQAAAHNHKRASQKNVPRGEGY